MIIAVTDGNETRSAASLADAIAAANKARAAIYIVAIESPKFNPDPLRKLAHDTGGAYHGASSSAALQQEYQAIASELKRTWRLEYATAVRPGEQAVLQANWLGQSSKPSLMVLPASLGPGAADPKPSRLLPNVLYETVLGTQVMAIVSFFIVLLGASLALTTVKGAPAEEAARAAHRDQHRPAQAQAGEGAPRRSGGPLPRDRERLRAVEALEAARASASSAATFRSAPSSSSI